MSIPGRTEPSASSGVTGPVRFRHLVRSASFATAAIVAILILSSVVPPIVADQSDRAVVNAPVALLTAPVAGDVEHISVRPGQAVASGETVARILNSRVDRSTLISLEGKAAETKGRAAAAADKRASNLAYLQSLDRTIREQTQQIATIFGQQITELRARLAASVASGQERKTVVDRQAAMVARNVASPEMLKPSEQQYAGALHQKDAETAKLSQKITHLESLQKGVFVGEDLAGLATLDQKRRDISFDAQRLAIEQTELEASLRDQQKLLSAERERLVSLTSATVEAPVAGEIMSVGAAAGRHVNAGDSLVTLVDCRRAVVVAIFSYRQAQNLSVGTRVEIESGDGALPRPGTVKEVLPRAGDKVDELYAVPFPQTERREMFVIVAPDLDNGGQPSGREPTRGAACNVGQWVTVTRPSGWIPSISVVWQKAGTQVSNTMSGLFSRAQAMTEDHRDRTRAL